MAEGASLQAAAQGMKAQLKDSRRIERAIQRLQGLNDHAEGLIDRLTGMRNRLLGSDEHDGSAKGGIAEVVSSEIHDLNNNLDALDARFAEIGALIEQLQQV